MLMLSLRAMLHLELPHINVLSKVDLIAQYGDLGNSAPLITYSAHTNSLQTLTWISTLKFKTYRILKMPFRNLLHATQR